MEPKVESTPKIVGVKFSKIGKNYYFDASKVKELKIGDSVVVETSRGWQIGELSEIVTDPELLKNASYKPVDRIATEEDLIKKNKLLEKNEKALKICAREVHNQKLEGVKIISADFSFDEKAISFLYSSDTDDQPNFEVVKKAVANEFPNSRIEFYKVGPRDIARYFGGMGACGMETRCCAKFLNNFDSISIRMAKKQGLSLTPSDITGMCDRLRCCLNYEYCTYEEALKSLPRKNKMVKTPLGTGKVMDIAPLRNSVYVYLEGVGIKEFDAGEVEECELTQEEKQKKKHKQVDSNSSQRQDHKRKFRRKKKSPGN